MKNSSSKKDKPASVRKSHGTQSEKKFRKKTLENLSPKEGTMSVDNRYLKRKSSLAYLMKNDEQIDCNKLDMMIDKLWAKFVVYYKYENIFPFNKSYLNGTPTKSSSDLDSDFDLKLCTYFKIYNIQKRFDNNLESNSDEGSYILKNVKIWIMHIKVLSDKYELDYSELLNVFEFALENNVDEHVLFDYFLTITQEFEEEEICDTRDKKIPSRFLEIYNTNKDNILTVLKEEARKENAVVDPILMKNDQIDKEVNANSNVEAILETIPETTEIGQNPELIMSFGNAQSNNDNQLLEKISEYDEFSFRKDEQQPTTKKQEDNVLEDKGNQTDQESLKSLNKYLIPNHEETLSIPGVLKEGVKSSSKMNQIKDKDKDKTPTQTKSKKKLEFYKHFNKHQDLDDAEVKELNLRNSGNFAVILLSAKSQEKVGHKFVLTPLTRTINKKEVEEDLRQAHLNYTDFIYQPYDEEIVDNIATNKGRRLSFSESKL